MVSFDDYFNSIDIYEFLRELNHPYMEVIMDQVRHFSEREAEERDQIVLNYLGKGGVKRIVKAIIEYLFKPPELTDYAKILDVGAGSGFFTVKIVDEVLHRLSTASFYAMDVTPAMLRVLMRRSSKIVPFIGVAENISKSIEYASKYISLPRRFDAVFSILTLHHCLDVEKVFESVGDVLMDYGKVIIVDLCEHSFEEFRGEMGDIHLGFSLPFIRECAEKFFPNVYIEKIPGICCECSGRVVELFIMYLTYV